MSTRAVLFDLDGTLLSTAGAGRQAMDGALRALSLENGLGAMQLDGMTDRAIVREALRAHRQPCTESRIDAAIARYLELLAINIANCTAYRVLPGVKACIDSLCARGIAVGLGTGNVEHGARIKLGPSGLNEQLPFGGFGSDHEDRAELLRAGVERASRIAGRALLATEVWIVGDTPKDIAAARAIGARVLAVATGRYSTSDLRARGADVTIMDLTQKEALASLMAE